MVEVVDIEVLTELPDDVTLSYAGYTVEQACKRFEEVSGMKAQIVFRFTCPALKVTTIYIPIGQDITYNNRIVKQ